MEFLPRSLAEINDAVSAIEKRLWLYGGDITKVYAWRMYGQIFAFLTHLVRWYTKRSWQRLRHSFNESLPEFFEDQLQEIKKTADLIREEAEFRVQADTRINLLYTESVMEKLDRFDQFLMQLRESDERRYNASERRYEAFRTRLEKRHREELQDKATVQTRLDEVFLQVKRSDIGQALAEILEGEARRHIQEWRSQEPRALLESPGQSQRLMRSISVEDVTDASGGAQEVETLRDELLLRSSALESFFDREQVQGEFEPSASFYTDPEIVSRMQHWATTPESGILCISGSEGSAVGLVAAQYAALSREAKLPVCSYFCRLQHEEPPAGRCRETMELVALVYSLIRQLIELMPMNSTSLGRDLDQVSFDALEGTMDSFSRALRILDALLGSTGQPILILVIDSFDILEDTVYNSTTSHLKDWVKVLKKHAETKEEGILKVLFTTSGTSFALLEELDDSDFALTDMMDSFLGGRGRQATEPFWL